MKTPTYFYHTSDPDVRIKVTKKLVVWERNVYIDVDDLDKGKVWKYYMRRPLPVTNAETLRKMYSLPDDVVAKLKGPIATRIATVVNNILGYNDKSDRLIKELGEELTGL